MEKINYIDLKKYVLLDKIGNGSFGDEIFAIKNKETDQIYAAKIYSSKRQFEKDKAKLKREIELSQQIQFTSVLKYYGFSPVNFQGEDKPVIITEYAPNDSLQKIIQLERSTPTLQEWDIDKKLISLYGIAAGMAYLHSLGIIHRNLSLKNVLLDEYLYPKINNYLFSVNPLNDSNQSITIAPEVTQDHDYTEKSDVFSFAFLAFELITGEDPNSAPKSKSNRPKINSIIGPTFDNLIRLCWNENPEVRPTFSKILAEFKKFSKLANITQEFLNYIDAIDQNMGFIYDVQPVYIYPGSIQKDSNKDKFNLMSDPICPPNILSELTKKGRILVSKAESNDNVSQYILGVNFFNAEGKYPKNDVISAKYLLRSIINGNEDAACFYCDSFLGIKNEIKLTENFIKYHCDETNPAIIYLQAQFYMKQDKFNDAIELFKKAAEIGSYKSAYQLGVMYRDGVGIGKNLKLSTEYFVKAKTLKNKQTPAQIDIESLDIEPNNSKDKNEKAEILYLKGVKSLKNDKPNIAIYFFKLAAKKKNVDSMKELYKIYVNGIPPLDHNYAKALEYSKMAAELGDVESIKNTASLLEKGDGNDVKPNLAESFKYYKNAAELGDVDSMYKYAFMLDQGEGTNINKKQACQFYKTAAEQGNMMAMYEYGMKLMNAEGCRGNSEKGVEFIKKSASLGYKKAQDKVESINADQGDVEAMFSYGMKLIENKNSKKTVKRGMKYLQMAAEQGHKEAKKQFKIAEINQLKHEIKQGNSNAMVKLAKFLIEGKKVKKDLNLAHKYLIRASKLNNSEAKIELKKLKEIQMIESKSPVQIVNYGKSLEFPKNGKKNVEKAQFFYKKAADLGNDIGMVNYARLLDLKCRDYRMANRNHKKPEITKEEFEEIEKEVYNLYKTAADKGNRIGMFHVGLCLEHGNGVKIDREEAVQYYHDSAHKGYPIAMSNYARCLEHGRGTEKNEKKALTWYKKAWDSGLEKSKGEYEYLYKKMKNENNDDDDDYDDDVNKINVEEEENKDDEEEENKEEEDNKSDIEDEENVDENDEEEEDDDVDENDKEDGVEDDSENDAFDDKSHDDNDKDFNIDDDFV